MTTPCGCTIEYGATDDVPDRIVYCPLHATAGAMRVLIAEWIANNDAPVPLTRFRDWFDEARALLRAVEG